MKKDENEGLAKKLLNIDQKIIFIILFLAFALPLLYPIVLPMKVDKLSQQAYDFVEALPEGSIILMENGNGASTYPQCGSGMVVQMVQLLSKDMKIVMFTCGPQTAFWADKAIQGALSKLPSDVPAENGVNWVHLGFVTGGETGVAALASDIRSVIKKDYYGTPIEEIPLLKDINHANDFDAVVWHGAAETSIPWGIRQVVVPFGLPMTGSVTLVDISSVYPYIDAGLLNGVVGGLKGSADYEYLMRMTGPALAQIMTVNIAGIFWIVLIIMGNILHFVVRKEEVGN